MYNNNRTLDKIHNVKHLEIYITKVEVKMYDITPIRIASAFNHVVPVPLMLPLGRLVLVPEPLPLVALAVHNKCYL